MGFLGVGGADFLGFLGVGGADFFGFLGVGGADFLGVGVGLALGFLAALDANFLAARIWPGGWGSGTAGLVVGGLAFDANFLAAAPGEARACGRSLTVRGLLE